MLAVTNSKFNEMVDDRLDLYEQNQGEPLGRQAKATKRGTLLEDVAVDLFKTHPNIKSIKTQVYKAEVDDFSLIDIVLHTKKGNTVYVSVARDLWLGTSQQDRLQVQTLKYKAGLLDDYHYCYLVGDSFDNFIKQKSRKGTRKKVTVQEWVQKLAKVKMLHTFETLWDHVKTL
jgi:hypothetical protein